MVLSEIYKEERKREMLHNIARSCTDYLLRYHTIQEQEVPVYLYGFELFWSTTLCIACILFTGIFLGAFETALTFILFFVPVRIPGGGYHAKSYRNCFLLTNALALLCHVFTYAASYWIPRESAYPMWILYTAATWYIWRFTPVIPKKYSLKPERVGKNRRYTHQILAIEWIVLLTAWALGSIRIVYAGIIASCEVAVLVSLARRGGE